MVSSGKELSTSYPNCNKSKGSRWIGPCPGAQQYTVHLQCRRHRRPGFHPRVRKSPWRRAWQPTPVFLPGQSYGQRSLAGYSPRVTESRTRLKLLTHTDKGGKTFPLCLNFEKLRCLLLDRWMLK